ncbi:MAG: AAA family ATPase, partial [Eubacteriaceae bacterium]|nr:AAA family ATPase [Eubacteriaceae bacterium]
MSATGLFIDEIRIDWEGVDPSSYLMDIEALRDTQSIPLRAPVTFFVGENGTGKSTLLEAVAVSWGFNPEGGTVNY